MAYFRKQALVFDIIWRRTNGNQSINALMFINIYIYKRKKEKEKENIVQYKEDTKRGLKLFPHNSNVIKNTYFRCALEIGYRYILMFLRFNLI